MYILDYLVSSWKKCRIYWHNFVKDRQIHSNSPSTCLPEKLWRDFKVPTTSPSSLHDMGFTSGCICHVKMLLLHTLEPATHVKALLSQPWRVERPTWTTILALKAFGSFKIPLALGAMDTISLKSRKFTAQPLAQILLFHGFVLRLRSSSLVENCQTWKPSESVRPRQVKDSHC